MRLCLHKRLRVKYVTLPGVAVPGLLAGTFTVALRLCAVVVVVVPAPAERMGVAGAERVACVSAIAVPCCAAMCRAFLVLLFRLASRSRCLWRAEEISHFFAPLFAIYLKCPPPRLFCWPAPWVQPAVYTAPSTPPHHVAFIPTARCRETPHLLCETLTT